MMSVAAAKVILDFYGNDSVAKKKAELEKLLKTLHRHFNVSAAEVADFDDPERCVLGIALSAGTQVGARKAMKKVLEHLDQTAFARVVMEDTDCWGFE